MRHDGGMLSTETAQALADAGIIWQPRPGDRFAILAEEMRDEIFWISDLTIEVHNFSEETILGFNGTTEWALDSVPLRRTLWLPREDQLRELLGSRLRTLSREGGTWMVCFEVDGEQRRIKDPDVEEAYARALLAIT